LFAGAFLLVAAAGVVGAHGDTATETWTHTLDGEKYRVDSFVDLDARALRDAADAGTPIHLDLGVAAFDVLLRPNDAINGGPTGFLDMATYAKSPQASGAFSMLGQVQGDDASMVSLTVHGNDVRGILRAAGRSLGVQPAWEVAATSDARLHRVVAYSPPPEVVPVRAAADDPAGVVPLPQARPNVAHTVHLIFLGDWTYCHTITDAVARMQSVMNDVTSLWLADLNIGASNDGIWCLTGDFHGNDDGTRIANLRSWGIGYTDHREDLHLFHYELCAACYAVAYGNAQGDSAALGMGQNGWGYSMVYQRGWSSVDINNPLHRSILAAHEVGHGFSAGHSYQWFTVCNGTCSSKQGVNASGSSMSDIALRFSPESISRVQTYGYPALASLGH
jgi:hypothetical protein